MKKLKRKRTSSLQKPFHPLRNQRGTLYEIPILIVLVVLLGAFFFGNLEKLGAAKALLKTAFALGFIAGPFILLFLVLWLVGFVQERFGKKPPH